MSSSPSRLPSILPRLAGELVVIVVGVLVALQLEAVHQGLEDRTREGEVLEALRSDLAVTLDRLDADIRSQEATVAAHRELFRLSEAEMLPAADSLGSLVYRGFYFSRLEPVRGTWDALVNSGDIRLIRSGELRSELTGLFGLLGEGFEDEDVSVRARVEMQLAVGEVGSTLRLMGARNRTFFGLEPGGIATTAEYRRLLTHPRYLSALTAVGHSEYFQLESYFKPVRERLRAALALIDAELER